VFLFLQAAQQAVVVPGVPASSSRDGQAGSELRGPEAALLSPRAVSSSNACGVMQELICGVVVVQLRLRCCLLVRLAAGVLVFVFAT
jgi:hypothetical protein